MQMCLSLVSINQYRFLALSFNFSICLGIALLYTYTYVEKNYLLSSAERHGYPRTCLMTFPRITVLEKSLMCTKTFMPRLTHHQTQPGKLNFGGQRLTARSGFNPQDNHPDSRARKLPSDGKKKTVREEKH